MKCFHCGKQIEHGVYIIEWDDDGAAIMTGEGCELGSIKPPPNERDIYCNDECLDAHEAI